MRLSRAPTSIALLVASACHVPDPVDPLDTDTVAVPPVPDDTVTIDTAADSDTEPAKVIDATCDDAPPTLRFGVGFDVLTPLAPYEDVEMYRQSSGGWVVPLALDLTNTPRHVLIDVTLLDIDTGAKLTPHPVVHFPLELLGTEPWDCAGSARGVPLLLDLDAGDPVPDPDKPWEGLCGHRATMTISVMDAQGDRLADAVATVTLQPEPNAGRACR